MGQAGGGSQYPGLEVPQRKNMEHLKRKKVVEQIASANGYQPEEVDSHQEDVSQELL